MTFAEGFSSADSGLMIVRTMGSGHYEMPIDVSHTVGHVKNMICKKTGEPQTRSWQEEMYRSVLILCSECPR